MQIGGGDCVRVEEARRLVRWILPRRTFDAAVDHYVRHVDALRGEFARHALREAAQREFAHGERGRLRIALHACRGAGEYDNAPSLA
jgi:hypothetical protein